jgi:hypothetical protein
VTAPDPATGDKKSSSGGGAGAGREQPAPAPEGDTHQPKTNGRDDRADANFGKAPEAAERSVPKIARMLGNAYNFVGGGSSGGPVAYGDNATAFAVTLATAPEGAKFWLAPIDDDQLADTIDTYVRTGVEDELDTVLRMQSLAYLSGESGTGRRTVALAALRRVNKSAPVAELHALRGSTLEDLAQHADFRSEPGCWLVRWDEVPDRIVLASLAGLAQRLGSYLVITGSPNEQNGELSRYLVDHRRGDSAAMFLAHLRSHLCAEGTCLDGCATPGRCGGRCIEQLLERCAKTPEIAEKLHRVRYPYLLVGAVRGVVRRRPASVEQVCQALDVSAPDVRPLAVRLLRGTSLIGDEVRPDPRRGHDPALTFRRCFRIAYALMSGCPIGLVAEIARDLIEIMLPPELTDDRGDALRPTWDEFGFIVDELVPTEMRSDTVPPDAEPTGDAGRMAWLADIQLMGTILDVAWNDYPHGQHGMLRWLEGLGSHGSPLVHQRAAIAAGLLASFDFENVYHGLIQEWATSKSFQRRHAAGLAMAFGVRNPAIAARIQERVYDWARGGDVDSPWLRDTALRAHLAGLANELPVRHVLDDLQEIAKSETHQHSTMVGMTIESVADLSTMDFVVTELTEWLDINALLALHSSRAVLALMGKEIDVDGRPRPLLLHWAAAPEPRTRLGVVLGRTLLRPETSFEAWQQLGGWIAIEGDATLTEVLFALLTELCRQPALRSRARFYLANMWRRLMPLNPSLDVLSRLVEGIV